MDYFRRARGSPSQATGWFADGMRAMSLDSMRAMIEGMDEGERGLLLEAVDAELPGGAARPRPGACPPAAGAGGSAATGATRAGAAGGSAVFDNL